MATFISQSHKIQVATTGVSKLQTRSAIDRTWSNKKFFVTSLFAILSRICSELTLALAGKSPLSTSEDVCQSYSCQLAISFYPVAPIISTDEKNIRGAWGLGSLKVIWSRDNDTHYWAPPLVSNIHLGWPEGYRSKLKVKSRFKSIKLLVVFQSKPPSLSVWTKFWPLDCN